MKKTILSFLFILSVIVGYTQSPANSDCGEAVDLTSANTCSPTTGTNLGVENTTYDNCDFYKYMVWYKFTATSTSQIIQVTPGTIQNFYIDVFNASCSSRFITCDYLSNTTITKNLSGLTIGTEYKIAISTTELSKSGTFDICLINAVPPANDDCSAAVSLVVNPGNVPITKTNGTTQFATQSLVACSGNADDDVWYSFTATQTSHRVFLQKNNQYENIILEAFSGNCGSLVSLQCISSGFDNTINSSTLLSTLTIGQTYFLRVYYEGTTPGEFNIGITSIPLNDDCPVAINLVPSLNDTFDGAIKGSSFDATKSTNFSYYGSIATDDDVWYSFTATQKVHKIKIKGWKANKGVIEVYKGSCASLININCDDYYGCKYKEMSNDTLIFTSDKYEIGENYIFRVFSSDATSFQSLFDVAVTSPYILPYDDCSGALEIPVSSSATCNNSTIINLNGISTASNQSKSCNFGTVSGAPEKDIYLKFTALSVQHRIKVSNGLGSAVAFQLLSGSCGALVAQGCSQDYDSLAHIGNLTIGQTYYVRVPLYYSSITTLNVCISTPTFAVNDECEQALPIAVSGNAGSCIITAGNLNIASQSQYNDCLLVGNPEKKVMRDVWYKFDATGSSHRIWLSNISTKRPNQSGGFYPKNIKFEVYGGSCTSKTQLDCSGYISSQEEKIVSGLTIGETYYIKVSSFHAGDIEFQLCIKNISPPINDVCSSASTLTVFNTWLNKNYTQGSTMDATATVGSNTCGLANSKDVWYKFTATNTNHQVSFRGLNTYKAIIDLTVAVYSGNCTTPVHLFCKKGDFTNLSDEILSLNGLTIGNEYLVKVYSFDPNPNNQGGFEIQVLDIPAPINDNCAAPKPLTIQNSSISFTYVTTETLFATQSTELVGCAVTGTPDDDIWFSFVPNKSTIRLLLASNFKDFAWVVYSGTCGSLSSVTCSSSVGSSSFSVRTLLNNLTPNSTYLLRLFSTSAVLRGKISVALADDTDVPPNDECINAVLLTPSANNTPQFTAGTTVNAKNNNSQCIAGNEVWYKFVATNTTQQIIFDGYLKAPAMTIFTGTCAGLTLFPSACFAGTHSILILKNNFTVGTTYYIKVAAQVALEENQGNFSIAVVTPSVPTNDNCINATPITVNNSQQYFSTVYATTDYGVSSCVFGSLDVWFKFTATKTKMNVVIDDFSTNASLGLYKGACPTPTFIQCSLESTGSNSGWKSNVLNLENLIIGDEYLIKVGAILNNYMDFKLKLSEQADISQNILFQNSCIGTNLVSNPSFENPETCPTTFVPTPSSPGQLLAQGLGWYIPTTGSSDYFSSCAAFTEAIEVPRNNVFGNQSPRNGIAYAGFFAGGSDYREYLKTELTTSMVLGKRYVMSMYVSRSDYYAFASNNIGFGLSLNSLVEFDSDTLKVDRVVIPSNNMVVHEKDEWVNIVAEITADQAYSYLYLGNFNSNKNSISEIAIDISGGQSGGYSGLASNTNSYYFVDDVFVGEIMNTIACGANNCNSTITLVRPTDDINAGVVNKSTNLSLNANINIETGAKATFTAGQYLLFDANNGVFEVKQGAVFEAKIGGCIN